MKPNIYAALIVKNEAHVIARTIEAVAPYVRGVVICDTGSADDTIGAAATACLGLGLSFKCRVDAWVDYAHNRSELLSLARVASCGEGYTWMLDADEVACGELPNELIGRPVTGVSGEVIARSFDATGPDAFHIARMLGDHEVWGVRIFSNRKPWRYEGAIHELPVCEGATVGRVTSLWVENLNDGAQGNFDPEAVRKRYAADAHHFANLCQANPADTRAAYYLAQSLRDAGDHGAAFAAYQRRGLMTEGFQEERYLSLLMVARYLRAWERPVGEVTRAFVAAIESRPSRHEAMVELAGYLNDQEEQHSLSALQAPHALAAMAWAHRANHTPRSSDLFLVHRPSHTWLPLYELTRASDLAGWHDVAAQCAKHLLGTVGTIGETERATLERIARNEPPC